MTHPPTTKALWTRADCFDAKHPHSATTAPLPAARGPHPILFLFILHMAAPSFLYPTRSSTVRVRYLFLSLSWFIFIFPTQYVHHLNSPHPSHHVSPSTHHHSIDGGVRYASQTAIQAGRHTGRQIYRRGQIQAQADASRAPTAYTIHTGGAR